MLRCLWQDLRETGLKKIMLSFIRFCLQVLIVIVPTTLLSFLVINIATLTKLEIAMASLLSAALPWLFYELLSRNDHQQKASKALLHFCESLEKMFSSMSVLQKKTEENPKELMAELKMLQGILHQITLEKQQRPAASNQTQANLNATYNQVVNEPSPRAFEAAIHTASKEQNREQNVSKQSQDQPHEPASAKVVNFNANKDKHTNKEDVEPSESETIIETNKPLTRNQLLTVIETALSSDHIEMLVQPIVSLPQRKARHFECFSRIKTPDGNIFTPDHFVHLAEEENLIRLLDNAMLFRCIQMARASVKKKFNVNFFCNVSQHTLSDKFFFDSLIEFFHSNPELGRNIILEFHEKAVLEKIDELEPLFRKLKLYDCRFSVDQVTNLKLDVKRLHKLNFKFIKFNSESLVNKIQTDEGVDQVKAFKKLCNAQNMDVIISHIEDEKSLVELNDFHFDYGQGYLFGSPVLSKS